MKVHLTNPSALAFGVGVITPRWLYVLAAATPESYGDPVITKRLSGGTRPPVEGTLHEDLSPI